MVQHQDENRANAANIDTYYFGNGRGGALAYIQSGYFSGTAAAANSVSWSNVSDKPFTGTTFNSGDNSNHTHDCNEAWQNGHYYYYSNGPSGLGESTSDGALYVQNYSSSQVGQIAQDYRNGRLFMRGKNNGSWTSWMVNLDSQNYSSYALPLESGEP